MPLAEYARIIRERGWIVAVTAIVAAAAALLFSLVQRPVYQSTIRLNVIGARPDFGLSQTVKSLLRNYAGQIRSYDTAVLALRDMPEPLDLTPEALLAKVNVQAVESDLQLVIEAEDSDPKTAQMIAQQMADTFVWVTEQFNLKLDARDRVNVFASGPATPGYRVRPQKKLNTLAGGILGAVVGAAIVIALEWLDSRFVRSAGDLAWLEDIRLLAAVPAAEPPPRRHWRQALPVGSSIPLMGGIALGILLATIAYLFL